MSESMPDLNDLYEAILTGDAPASVELVETALAAGADPKELVTGQMIRAMDEVGRRFEEGEYFVPELLIAGRAMKGALEILRPLLAELGVEPAGRVVIGTVKGDLHDIGKNLVAMMWKGANIQVHDVGTNVSPEDFIKAVRENNADVIGLSALLTTTMPAIKATVDAIRAAGLKDVKIIIGGAPVTQAYADEIGADSFAPDAVTAVDHLREAVGLTS